MAILNPRVALPLCFAANLRELLYSSPTHTTAAVLFLAFFFGFKQQHAMCYGSRLRMWQEWTMGTGCNRSEIMVINGSFMGNVTEPLTLGTG